MVISMKDVAKKAGVSVATVSHVINNTRYVSSETREKVELAMKELNYTPNSVARSLRTKKSKTIGLLVPDISNFFFTEIAESIDKILRKDGYNLVLWNTDESLEIECQGIKLLNSEFVRGIIIAPTDYNFNYRELLKESTFPLVFIDREPINFQGDTVIVDGRGATREVINILIEKGHKRIGYIMGRASNRTSIDRYLGYVDALKDHGIELGQDLVCFGDSRLMSGYRLCYDLLKKKNITAVFVANNLMTVGAMQCLVDQKIKVPEQVAIIGFDDYNWATITNPPLSTIRQPAKEIGFQAAKLIIERIRNPDVPYKKLVLSAKFIQRSSS